MHSSLKTGDLRELSNLWSNWSMDCRPTLLSSREFFFCRHSFPSGWRDSYLLLSKTFCEQRRSCPFPCPKLSPAFIRCRSSPNPFFLWRKSVKGLIGRWRSTAGIYRAGRTYAHTMLQEKLLFSRAAQLVWYFVLVKLSLSLSPSVRA